MFNENSNSQYGQKVNLNDQSYVFSQEQERIVMNQSQKGKKIFFIAPFLAIIFLFCGL